MVWEGRERERQEGEGGREGRRGLGGRGRGRGRGKGRGGGGGGGGGRWGNPLSQKIGKAAGQRTVGQGSGLVDLLEAVPAEVQPLETWEAPKRLDFRPLAQLIIFEAQHR